jgi:hypothetical protein
MPPAALRWIKAVPVDLKAQPGEPGAGSRASVIPPMCHFVPLRTVSTSGPLHVNPEVRPPEIKEH